MCLRFELSGGGPEATNWLKRNLAVGWSDSGYVLKFGASRLCRQFVYEFCASDDELLQKSDRLVKIGVLHAVPAARKSHELLKPHVEPQPAGLPLLIWMLDSIIKLSTPLLVVH